MVSTFSSSLWYVIFYLFTKPKILKNLLRRNLTYTTNDALQNVYISFHMAILDIYDKFLTSVASFW